MVILANSQDENSGENIRITLNVLKKHINQYNLRDKYINSKSDLTRSRRIEELIMEEKHLSQQFHQIRKEIKRYERKYEKILKRKVKLMAVKIKDDLYRLNTLKQKYKELNAQISKTAEESKPERKESSKRTCQVRQRMKRKLRKFGQKNVPFNKKIKIKIKKNEKLGRREMLFINENGQQQLDKYLKIRKPTVLNTRECKIMLERLTTEQMNRIMQQRWEQQKSKEAAANFLQKSNVTNNEINNEKTNEKSNEIAADKPNWHIKIPKSVFEEIQKEDGSSGLNVTSPIRNITTRQVQNNAN
ncbi:uncharacterized protein LOC105662915 [Megachile rotundata]|uniref:uncharacterized protein LOC105662915 n=1 Tax=Megachile rotundata TaxID=143995 RepID=UPI000614E49A|nr:PREDICTED: uncharacterized protein LOC105662915 [Megachile rotundata]XP_012144166.1 PREDICTED: uncharacterized protein LOC105662915 [Megachile rotundata]